MIRRMRALGLIAFSMMIAGCGGAGAGADASIRLDSGAQGDSGSDSGAARDSGATSDSGAGPGADSGTSTDAGAAEDAGTACPAGSAIPDRLAGVCDGRGRIACATWAEEHGGSTATAQCRFPDGRCARADSCTDDVCTCGTEPECGDDQMCVSGFAGYTCVCLNP
jgi:hypothetical protein